MSDKMNTVTITNYTNKNPLEMMGFFAGVCYGSKVDDPEKNKARGIDCIKSNHGRVMEFPEIYMIIDGYSAAVCREFYTHIGGAPTRLQASTRYIDYAKNQAEFILPISALFNQEALDIYQKYQEYVYKTMNELKDLGIPKEDYTKLLPLCAETKWVVKINLRTLISMARKRMCTRAYWEYRSLMLDIIAALSLYSPEWEEIIDMNLLVPECEYLGWCPEKFGCGRKKPKEE